MKVKVTALPKSIVEIEGELSGQEFAAYRPRAISRLSAEVKVDGFREGKAPEAVLLQKVGEMAVLQEMAELALEEAYPKLVEEHKLDVIGPPDIAITKIGQGSVLGFKIKSAVVPALTLPRYKAIAKETLAKKEATEATDKEVDEALEELRKARGVKKEGEEKPSLPELDDEFAKALGAFETLVDLKKKLKENIGLEKAARAKEKKRVEMIEKIAAETAGEVPDLLVESESEKMLLRLKGDLERFNLKFEDYLKNVGKSETTLKEEWKPEAEKRAKIELVLMKIADAEKLTAAEEEIEKEVKHVLEHYKDVPAGKQAPQENRVRDYVSHLLQNEKVFEFLEREA